jgi:K+-sensing histidine kinase KdpD
VSEEWTSDQRLVRSRAEAAGLVFGCLAPLVVAAIFVPFRDEAIVDTNVALVLVVVVRLAALGVRRAGAVGAIVAAISYDFFFTRPYQSLKIDNAEDIGTTVMLLVIGLLAAEVAVFARRHRRSAAQSHDEILRLHRVAELVAGGSSSQEVAAAVEHELVELMGLRSCHFERPPFSSMLPELGRRGGVEATTRRWVDGELTLPPGGMEIPVLVRGEVRGRLVLEPGDDVGVSIEERTVAVALSDQLGAALAAEASV